MPSYHAAPTRPDRIKAFAGILLIYAAIVALMLLVPADSPVLRGENEPTLMLDIAAEEPPAPQEDSEAAELEQGEAGKQAEPTPVVAPEPQIMLPATPPVAAAPQAGTGSAESAGAAAAGSGPGAGGSGTGRGGGGRGEGGGLGTMARLLGGNSARLPSHLLRTFAADRGFAHLMLTISAQGRASECSVLQSTGDGRVDQALCELMKNRSRWAPARDLEGRPVEVQLRYTATWSKN